MKIKSEIKNLDRYKKYLAIEEKVNKFLKNRGYLKIDLPILSPALIPEAYLEIFETEFLYFNKKEKLYLTPSPELFLKRLLAYGIGDCYYLGKSFRNSDPPSTLHSFEFTMLEFYKMGVSYMDIAEEVLLMLRSISPKIVYQGKSVAFDKWEKISVAEAFSKYCGISDKELFNEKLFINRAREKNYQTDGFSYEDIWSQVYTSEVEPNLGKGGSPTLIYDYPKQFASLAKLNSDGTTAQRFEFYIEGVEIGDCYTELVDWKEQNKRFNEENDKRKKTKKINHPIDKGFIEALQYGLKPVSGIAIGFERLAMIFTNSQSISQLKLINIL